MNPDGVRNQIEGGAVQSASWTLRERVRFDRRRVTSVDWETYPILRFSQVPAVDVTGIVDRIGTGDAFAAGVLARIDCGISGAAATGLALAALKHGIAGDHSMASPRDLAAFETGHADVRR